MDIHELIDERVASLSTTLSKEAALGIATEEVSGIVANLLVLAKKTSVRNKTAFLANKILEILPEPDFTVADQLDATLQVGYKYAGEDFPTELRTRLGKVWGMQEHVR